MGEEKHVCNHEGDIASLLSSCNNMAANITEIKKTNENIYKILNGNGTVGLVTKVSILENNAQTQPSAKTVMLYGSIGGGITVIFGFLLKAIIGG